MALFQVKIAQIVADLKFIKYSIVDWSIAQWSLNRQLISTFNILMDVQNTKKLQALAVLLLKNMSIDLNNEQ